MSVNVERMRRYLDRTVSRRFVVTDAEMMRDADAVLARANAWEARTRRAYPGHEIVVWEDYGQRQRVAERRRRP